MNRSQKLKHLSKTLWEIWWPILKPIFWAICFMVVLLVLVPRLGRLFFSSALFDPIEPITISNTEILTNTLPLQAENYWSIKGVTEQLQLTEDNLIILTVSGFRGDKLVVIDLETGEFYWRELSNIRSVDTDGVFVFVGMINDVQAYNLRTGDPMWYYKEPDKGRGRMLVFVKSNGLKVYDKGIDSRFVYQILTLDPRTGEILQANNDPGHVLPPTKDYTIAIGADLVYRLQDEGKRIVGYDYQTNNEKGILEISASSIYNKVAASEKYVVFYGASNQELILFRRMEQ